MENQSTASSLALRRARRDTSTRDARETFGTMASTTCAVAGERGSGKTTLVNALVREALRVDRLGNDDEENDDDDDDDDDAVEEVRSRARELATLFFVLTTMR
jgi:predicted ATPase